MMKHYDSSMLSEAVRVWTGWPQSMMPLRDDAMASKHFGEAAATELLSILRALAEEFYSTDARFIAADLQEMGTLAAAQFKSKHPDLPSDISEAFAWCYTFDFK